jgi:hypothetical protein
MAKKGLTGGPMQLQRTPAAEKRARKRRAAEERRWQRMNGPVTVRKLEEPEGETQAPGSESPDNSSQAAQ